MKKTFTILLTAILTLFSLTACGNSSSVSGSQAESNAASAAGKTVTVGLIQFVEHPSLDEIRTAITGELEAKAGDYGLSVKVDYKNAQADMSMINSICRQFVNDKVDVIIAIATPAAQGAATATSTIPVIFSAVTDPVGAGLVADLEKPDGNITGTSDAIDVEKIFALAGELTQGIKRFGFIYNKGESNSVSVIAQAKACLDGLGIAYEEKTVTSAGEVQQAARVLLESNDAVFAPIDNTVASAMRVLADEAISAGKPVYVAADSMVNDGGLATAGVNYTQLGIQTADMALRVLSGVSVADIPVEVLTQTSTIINEETASALGLDVSKYLP